MANSFLRRYRCSECGYPMKGLEIDPPVCPNHPEAQAVRWYRRLEYAYEYVLRQSAEGVDLEAWVERAGPEWTGVSRGDLAEALVYARRWREARFREGQLPEIATPRGLYG